MNASPSDTLPPARTERNRSRRLLETLSTLIRPFLALGIVVGIFAIADGRMENGGNFLSLTNFRFIAIQAAVIGVAALGMTVVIIAGGIDLSTGTAIALAATVLAWCLREDVALLMVEGQNVADVTTRPHEEFPPGEVARKPLVELLKERQDAKDLIDRLTETNGSRTLLKRAREKLAAIDEILPDRLAEAEWIQAASEKYSVFTPWLAIPLAILAGCLAGAINGVFISYSGVVPFIVTLGTMRVYLGLAKRVASETTVRPDRDTQVPDWLLDFLSSREHALFPQPLGNATLDPWLETIRFPLGVWLMFVLAILLALTLRYAVFGRHVFALGSNEATARLCGIRVKWNKVLVYTLGGLFIGIAGVYQFAKLAVGNPTSGVGMELEIIAAVVIGGGSLAGGRGSVLGTIIGALIIQVIVSGCTQLELPNWVQDISLGGIIVIAVAIDSRTRSRTESKG